MAKRKPKAAAPAQPSPQPQNSNGLRIRNIGLQRVRVADLEDAPLNFRTHPEAQQEALQGVVKEIGFYGYPDVYLTSEGKVRLCDGHLRKVMLLEHYGADTEIDVNVTDFSEQEALKAMATKDPLAAMAETNAAVLEELLANLEVENEAMQAMLATMAINAGIDPPEFEPGLIEDQGALDRKALTICPQCGHGFAT